MPMRAARANSKACFEAITLLLFAPYLPPGPLSLPPALHSVLVEYDVASTLATFRVWFPRAVDLAVSDASLGLVLPGASAGDPDLGRGADVASVISS